MSATTDGTQPIFLHSDEEEGQCRWCWEEAEETRVAVRPCSVCGRIRQRLLAHKPPYHQRLQKYVELPQVGPVAFPHSRPSPLRSPHVAASSVTTHILYGDPIPSTSLRAYTSPEACTPPHQRESKHSYLRRRRPPTPSPVRHPSQHQRTEETSTTTARGETATQTHTHTHLLLRRGSGTQHHRRRSRDSACARLGGGASRRM